MVGAEGGISGAFKKCYLFCVSAYPIIPGFGLEIYNEMKKKSLYNLGHVIV